jgi:hypothetical protein
MSSGVIVGSRHAEDRKVPKLGERPGATASAKLAVAVEHADNIRRLLLEDRTLPIWSHLTLARPVFEASVQTRWLLDPALSATGRIGRALGAALDDLEWRRKAEDDLCSLGWTFSANHQKAEDRRKEVEGQAATAGISVIPLLDTTSLMGKYSLVPGKSDSYLWRYLSGVLHTVVPATAVGETEKYQDGALSWERHEASTELTGDILVTAIQHLESAIRACVSYLEP